MLSGNIFSSPAQDSKDQSNSVTKIIVDVSRQGNNCGLFALILGIKHALSDNPALANAIDFLEFIKTISEIDIEEETENTSAIGKKLREKMYQALINDNIYKERRRNGFVSACREFLATGDEKNSFSADMASFMRPSKVIREALQKEWVEHKISLDKAYDEKAYGKKIRNFSIQSETIVALKTEFNQIVPNPTFEEVQKIFGSYYKNDSLIDRLIKLRRLSRSAWYEVKDGESENRGKLGELIEKFFIQEFSKHFSQNLDMLLLFSFLQEAAFEANGNLSKVGIKKDVLSTAVRLFIESRLSESNWNDTYKKYCSHVKNSTEMLTGDELGCLAKHWKVQLVIEHHDGELQRFYDTVDATRIQLTLCNPTLIHWQVSRLIKLSDAIPASLESKSELDDEESSDQDGDQNDISINDDLENARAVRDRIPTQLMRELWQCMTGGSDMKILSYCKELMEEHKRLVKKEQSLPVKQEMLSDTKNPKQNTVENIGLPSATSADVPKSTLVKDINDRIEKDSNTKLVDGLEPFMWQIKKRYTGILENIEHLTEPMLNEYLDKLKIAIQDFEQKRELISYETEVKDYLKRILREHLQRRMARELTDDRILEKDLGHKNDQKLEDYYTYTYKTHFNYLLRYSADTEEVTTPELLLKTDRQLFSHISDPLWQLYINESLENLSQITYYNHNGCVSIGKPGITWRTHLSNKPLMDQLKKEKLYHYLQKIIDLEDQIYRETISNTPKNIHDMEQKSRGSYVAMLEDIQDEVFRLSLRMTHGKEDATTELAKLYTKIINSGLYSGFVKLTSVNIGRIRLDFQKELEELIEKKRLKLYVDTLKQYEINKRRYSERQRDKYIEARQEIEDNPNSADYDYDGIVLPDSPLPYTAECFYDNKSLNNLDSLDNLINICGNGDNFDWLIREIAEYNLDITESIIKKIDFSALEMDRDVAETILHSLIPFRNYVSLNDNFIAHTFLIGLKELHNGTIMGKQDSKIEVEDDLFLFNRNILLRRIKNNFAKVKKLISLKKLDKLKEDFNQAYLNNNLVELQRLWYVFAKFQRLLNSTEGLAGKSKIAKTGTDYTLVSKMVDYNELLRKAYASYEKRVSEYYRIYPDHGTCYLTYSTKNIQKPNKKAVLDFALLLKKLQFIGEQIKAKLTEAKKDNTTNVVVPMLCFVVTNKPHEKGKDHARIFVSIALVLKDSEPDILSKDVEDGVFKNDKSFYDVVAKEEKDGSAIVHVTLNKVSKEFKATDLHHSERVFFEILRSREAVKQIVLLLQKKLASTLGTTALEAGRYKVYSVSLFFYSTNSVCNRCSVAMIATQNSYQAGFLKLLAEELQDSKKFKVRGYSNKNKILDPTKFRLFPFALSGKPFTSQAKDFYGSESKKQTNYNPNAKLFFHKDCIDMHKVETTSVGAPLTQQKFFFEFVNPPFSSINDQKEHKFSYRGLAFMSGSKKEASYKTKKGVAAFNKIRAILSGRDGAGQSSLSKI